MKCAAVDQQTAQEAGTPPDLHVMGTRKRPRDAGGGEGKEQSILQRGKKDITSVVIQTQTTTETQEALV